MFEHSGQGTVHVIRAHDVLTSERMEDMKVDPYKVAAALIGVVAQRLVRTVCPKCRNAYYPSDDLLNVLHYKGDKRRSFVRGEGCRECHDTGFRGRTGIYEVLSVDAELRDLIGRGQAWTLFETNNALGETA